jgi:hypothetical protein
VEIDQREQRLAGGSSSQQQVARVQVEVRDATVVHDGEQPA